MGTMYARILVPLDGSALAERVLPYVETLAHRFDSTILLVRATTPPEEITPAAPAGPTPLTGPTFDPLPVLEAEVRAAATYLAAMAERLTEAGLAVESIQQDGAPAAVILDTARTREVDLIAMTTHGRGGLARLAFGSVADEVLRHAPCPVLLVRAQPAPSA
jgi:nucleotide-binding universal stress UspA family protein